jgi:predicted transport protein
MAATPDDMMSAVSASLAARTGRSLDEWVALVQASGVDPLDQNAVRRWLRAEHGVAQNSQWAIADAAARAAGWERPSVDEYIDGQYRGAKAALRPIYDSVAAVILGLGDDVTVEGRGTYTPFVRARQFAAVAPAAKDRVDLGLRFTGPPPTSTVTAGRLVPAKGLAQATHKIALRSVAEVDDEVRDLLRLAYEQNG